jgi:hypothetical protein
MPARPRRRTPTIALIVTLLGAAAVMVSPITPWPAAVALCGAALVVAGVAVLLWWLLRNWSW